MIVAVAPAAVVSMSDAKECLDVKGSSSRYHVAASTLCESFSKNILSLNCIDQLLGQQPSSANDSRPPLGSVPFWRLTAPVRFGSACLPCAACRSSVWHGEGHSLEAMDALTSLRWCCPDTGAEASSFGDLVRLVRLSCGVSQTTLGARLGVSQPVVSKWESGRCAPHSETVSRVAEALGVSFLMASERVPS